MNDKQSTMLTIVFLVLMLFFIRQDLIWNSFCSNAQISTLENERSLDAMDVSACVKAEVYAPFITTSFALSLIIPIYAWLGKKK